MKRYPTDFSDDFVNKFIEVLEFIYKWSHCMMDDGKSSKAETYKNATSSLVKLYAMTYTNEDLEAIRELKNDCNEVLDHTSYGTSDLKLFNQMINLIDYLLDLAILKRESALIKRALDGNGPKIVFL